MPQDVTTMQGFLSYINEAMGGIFGVGVILSVWFVIFLSLSQYPTDERGTAATFISALLSYFMFALGIVGGVVPLLMTIAAAASGVYLYMSSQRR